jgi:cell division protein FtsQ
VWDNPRLLNLAADALYVAAAFLAAALAWHAALHAPYLPVRHVVLVGDVSGIEAEAVHEQLAGRVSGTFLTIDLDRVRRLLAELPRVRDVDARRAWPDTIVVRIERHVPLANWSARGLVSARGELFDGEPDPALPQLGGPPGAEREVVRRYLALRELAAPLGVEPVQVLASARYAWQVKLSNGMTVELGRDDARQPIESRFARFVAAYPRAGAILNRQIDYVDLRYPNGFAIRVPGLPGPEEQPQPARRRG